MLHLAIPGRPPLALANLVLDYNGTLAVDGQPIPGVMERLRRLSEALHIHVLTADTFGTATAHCAGTLLMLHVIPTEDQASAKLRYVGRLGTDTCIAIGNGRNDHLMLEAAALGIAVTQAEGASPTSLAAADVVFGSILDALDALLAPKRLVATLRT